MLRVPLTLEFPENREANREFAKTGTPWDRAARATHPTDRHD